MSALHPKVYTVQPDPSGGWLVTCDGVAMAWFPLFPRAMNEVRRLTASEHTRIERVRASAQQALERAQGEHAL